MRMNQFSKLTAAKILNEYEEEDLANVFYYYGELRNARKLAKEVVAHRSIQPIRTVEDVKEIFNYIPKNRENKFRSEERRVGKESRNQWWDGGRKRERR